MGHAVELIRYVLTSHNHFVKMAEFGECWLCKEHHFLVMVFDSQCEEGYELDSNGKCAEINACLSSPCSIHVECIDRPAPADGTQDGRVCMPCPSDFVPGPAGDGEECVCEQSTHVPVDGECVDIGKHIASKTHWLIL